jgi:hypothetical protein
MTIVDRKQPALCNVKRNPRPNCTDVRTAAFFDAKNTNAERR